MVIRKCTNVGVWGTRGEYAFNMTILTSAKLLERFYKRTEKHDTKVYGKNTSIWLGRSLLQIGQAKSFVKKFLHESVYDMVNFTRIP